MVSGNDIMTAAAENELVITRLFDAPRELVFKAWTEPEHFVQWWGPHGFSTPHCTIDLREGGKLFYCMRSAEYGDLWCGGVFQEIDPPSRLVFVDYFADQQGNPVPPSTYGMGEGMSNETLVTVLFEEEDGKTRMTLTHAIPSSSPEQAGAIEGWSQSFERLATHLAQG